MAPDATQSVTAIGPGTVAVPKVVGVTQADATTAIKNAGLALGTVATQASDTVSVGNVISQNPVGGNTVDTGSVVDLKISSGAGPVTVPNVVGSTQTAATAAITGVGLVVGTVTTQTDGTIPAGRVISQSPAAGTTIDPGATQQDLSSLVIKYSVAVKATQPMNVQDLMSLIGILAGTAAGPGAPVRIRNPQKTVIGLYGGGIITGISSLPDAITISAQVTSSTQPPIKSSDTTLRQQARWDQIAMAEKKPEGYRSTSPRLLRVGLSSPGDEEGYFSSRLGDETNGAGFNPARGNAQQAPASAAAPSGAAPSATDCQVALSTGASGSCTFSQAYTDEGLYHWDVSVGVPLNTVEKPTYSSVDGIVTANKVSTLNAYGFFDIYPVPTDIIQPPMFDYPHIMFGLPFSGAVLDKPFFGAGGILNIQQIPKVGTFLAKFLPIQFNLYGGVVWDKEPLPKSIAVGSVASSAALSENLIGHRVWKGQFGVEFSLRDVKSKLTSSSSKAGNAQSASSTSTSQ